jgi:hypothetical protein
MKLRALVSLGFASLLAISLPAAAHIEVFATSLTGPGEAPPNKSLGTGQALVTFDFDQARMRVQVTFSGLSGITTASHIHCCTAIPGVSTAIVATQTPTFIDFPLGVTSGSYDHTFDMTVASSYNPAFITAQGGTVGDAFNALALGLEGGTAYLNIHTDLSPGGEIRGFLHTVPEPQTLALVAIGIGALALRRRRAVSA